MKLIKINTKLAIFFVIGTFCLFPQSCTKERADVIPDTPVYLSVNLINFPIGISQSRIFTNTMVGLPNLGYHNNGIIVYREEENKFYAYDRTCTYQVESAIAVDLDYLTTFAVCPECNSKYQLWFSGFPTDEGPSVNPLKQYAVSYNPNTQDLVVQNF